jgi:predicted amidohydrolase YtcJ
VAVRLSGRRNTSRSSPTRATRKRRARITRATRTETSSKTERDADTIFLNAQIITLDSRRPRAQALAIEHGHVAKIGTDRKVLSVAGKGTQVWNLDAATVLPGFTDCHTHLVGYAIQLYGASLRKATSISEIESILRKQAEKTRLGRWVLGYGWDQEKLEERRFPNRFDLDAAVSDRPVCIFRVCEHVCVANSAALELANITRTTAPPIGEVIDRQGGTGEPTGVLRENAMDLVLCHIPALDGPELRKATSLAMRKAVSAGLTSIHCVVDQPQHVRVLQAMNRAGELRARIYVLIPDGWLGPAGGMGISTGFGDEMLRIQAIKVFTDGSLGARTAALDMPYSDSPDTRGVLIHSQDQLNSIVESASRQGFQVAIHAIGDQAIAMALTAIENARITVPECDRLRHRIEHASVLNPELIKRVKLARVIASVQPHFIPSDRWVPARVGRERAKFVYALKSLLKSGATVVGGSDCPVEPIDPLEGISAAVTSATEDYGERVGIQDALKMFTKNAAYATYEEKLKGTIQEGKMADLVVLDRDPLEVSPEQVRKIKVLATVVGGRIMYASKRFQAMKASNGRHRPARRRS